LNTKTTITYEVRNPDPGLGQAQIYGRIRLVIGSPMAIHINVSTSNKKPPYLCNQSLSPLTL
jgi:hypothetical protein